MLAPKRRRPFRWSTQAMWLARPCSPCSRRALGWCHRAAGPGPAECWRMDGRGFARLKTRSGAHSSPAPWATETLVSRLPRSGSVRWPITSNSCFSCSECGVLVAVGGIRTLSSWGGTHRCGAPAGAGHNTVGSPLSSVRPLRGSFASWPRGVPAQWKVSWRVLSLSHWALLVESAPNWTRRPILRACGGWRSRIRASS